MDEEQYKKDEIPSISRHRVMDQFGASICRIIQIIIVEKGRQSGAVNMKHMRIKIMGIALLMLLFSISTVYGQQENKTAEIISNLVHAQ
jgi:hypothetical protein